MTEPIRKFAKKRRAGKASMALTALILPKSLLLRNAARAG